MIHIKGALTMEKILDLKKTVAELVEAIVADGVRAAAADACRGRLARIP